MLIKRTVFTLSLAILFSGLMLDEATAQTRQPETKVKPTTVIVHGAWGGGWAFRRVDALLTERGHDVYRPSLTGLGERVHLATLDVGLSTHIDDVVNTILFEDLRDVTLIGHSYGGMVITGVADRVPDRIRRLVYLDAFVPNDGESVETIIGARGEWLKSMTKNGFMVPPWVKPEQPFPRDVPHPLKAFTEPLALKNAAARRTPATYILTVDKGRAAKDDDFALHAERAKKRGWTVLQLEADHNPQRSAPEALVEMLERDRASIQSSGTPRTTVSSDLRGDRKQDRMFVHAVYFWLRNDLTEKEKSEFVKGLASLTTIESVGQAHVGVPAATDREIIDRSYSYALTVVFPDKAAHDAYQVHPTHDKFRDSCSRFWSRIQIYDSVNE